MTMKNWGVSTLAAFTIHGLYEVKDFYKREIGQEFNSSLNSVADQGVAMLGHFLAKKDSDTPYMYLFVLSFIILTVTGVG